MAQFKISYKLLQESVAELNGVSSDIMEYADGLKKIGDKLTGDSSLTAIQKNLKDGAAKMEEFTQGLKGIAQVMETIIEAYSNTEENNSKKVDGAKAHNRDFYKNPVSVPSASGGGGGGGSPTTVNAAIQNNTANINIVDASRNTINRVNETFHTAAAPAAAAAAPIVRTVSVPAAPTPSSGGSAGAAAAAAIAGGVAAAAGGVAAAVAYSKKKQKDGETEPSTQAAKDLAIAEKKLEEAMARTGAPKADS